MTRIYNEPNKHCPECGSQVKGYHYKLRIGLSFCSTECVMACVNRIPRELIEKDPLCAYIYDGIKYEKENAEHE